MKPTDKDDLLKQLVSLLKDLKEVQPEPPPQPEPTPELVSDSFALGTLGEFPTAQPMPIPVMLEEMFNADLSRSFFPARVLDPFQ
jgi:hypothetical protein